MTINNELLAKFEGKWKEWKLSYLVDGLYNVDYDSLNPSYSTSPDDRERLWGYLMGKEEMWMTFYLWAYTKKEPENPDRVVYDWPFVSWLTLPLDGVPRWVSLLSEWLRLDETVERWGYTECKNAHCCECHDCAECNGSGRIRAEWARYAKEG